MRILHVVPSYFPAVRYGGPIHSVHGLCKALVERNHEVHVFTTNVDGPEDSNVPLGVPVDLDGVKVNYFPVPSLRRLYWSPAMGKALRQRLDGFDILHTHSVFLWPTWAAARAAPGAGVPYLVSPRGMMVQELIARKNPFLKRAWIALFERRNLERASAIHVTSDAEAAELERFHFALPRIHMVPNGVTADPGQDAPGELPQAISEVFATGRPVVLCLGRISWKKGLDRLIAAIARVPTVILLIVGNDDEGYTGKLREFARKDGVLDRTVIAGPVFGPAKAQLYQRASLLALASYSENFGNVVLEAMIEGCPVVVTPEVGAATIVEASGGGVVVQGSPEAFGDAIQKLIADPVLRAEMGNRARQELQANYSWDAVAAQFAQVYGSMTQKRES
jgi:glycosyltransferase involved in cell wall biosynthesis